MTQDYDAGEHLSGRLRRSMKHAVVWFLSFVALALVFYFGVATVNGVWERIAHEYALVHWKTYMLMGMLGGATFISFIGIVGGDIYTNKQTAYPYMVISFGFALGFGVISTSLTSIKRLVVGHETLQIITERKASISRVGVEYVRLYGAPNEIPEENIFNMPLPAAQVVTDSVTISRKDAKLLQTLVDRYGTAGQQTALARLAVNSEKK